MPSPSPATRPDPLWRAFEQVLGFYRLRTQQQLARADIAIDWSQPLTARGLTAVALHMGLEVRAQDYAATQLGELPLPAVAVGEGACRLFLPGQGWTDIGTVAAPATFIVLQFDRPAAAAKSGLLDPRVRGGKWFWEALWRSRRSYLDVMLATFFVNLFALFQPIFSMNVYDRVVPNQAEETLFALTFGIVLVYAFNLAFKIIRGHILEGVSAQFAARIDSDLMEHLLRLTAHGQTLTVGEKSDLFREMQQLRDFFAARFIPAILDLPFLFLFLLVIYLIAPGLMPVVLAGIVLMFAANLVTRVPANRMADKLFQESRHKNALLVELLSGAQAIRLFNAIGSRLFLWQRVAQRTAVRAQHSQHVMGIADDISVTIMYLINVFLLVVGVFEIHKGELTVGGLVACSILVSRAISPVMNMAMVAGRLRQSLNALRLIDRIFGFPVEPRLPAGYIAKGPFTGQIQLSDVSFHHPGQVHPTLRQVSLRIAPGERIGLIGNTGAGKSTITHILDGSLVPQSGQVLVDGTALEGVHPQEWRQGLGIVPQESFFMAGTLRDNILFGLNDELDEAWLRQVLGMAGLDLIIQQTGFGLDFQVGEQGMNLSGGQRQAVALARALVRKPRILLLDEPTNGMDNALEQRVIAALADYCRDKTLLLVTHRTALLALVDRLVLVNQGRIAADGPKAEVMKLLAAPAQVAHG